MESEKEEDEEEEKECEREKMFVDLLVHLLEEARFPGILRSLLILASWVLTGWVLLCTSLRPDLVMTKVVEELTNWHTDGTVSLTFGSLLQLLVAASLLAHQLGALFERAAAHFVGKPVMCLLGFLGRRYSRGEYLDLARGLRQKKDIQKTLESMMEKIAEFVEETEDTEEGLSQMISRRFSWDLPLWRLGRLVGVEGLLLLFVA